MAKRNTRRNRKAPVSAPIVRVAYTPKPDKFANVINFLGNGIDKVVFLFTKVI